MPPLPSAAPAPYKKGQFCQRKKGIDYLAVEIGIDHIMNRLSQYRSAWRKTIRLEEITTFKKNIRNLIYYQQPAESSTHECALCRDDRWLYTEDARHIVRLLLAVFHEGHVCNAHIEAFLSKTLECLQAEPAIYGRLMSRGGRQQRELVYRKILLLLEVFDNQLLLENEAIWEEISVSFRERSEFMVKLMDCAYSYDDWPVEDHLDENWDSEVKSICYSSVLNIFGKFPILFHNYLQEYPISILLQKSRGKKRVEVLSLLKGIVTHSEEKNELEGTVYLLFVGFKSHLREIEQLQHSLEVFVGELDLFKAFAVGWRFVDLEAISCLLCFINTNIDLHAHAYELIFTILQFVKEAYCPILDQPSFLKIGFLNGRMSQLAHQNTGKTVISEDSSSMEAE